MKNRLTLQKWALLFGVLTLIGAASTVSYLMTRPAATFATAVNAQLVRFEVWVLLTPIIVFLNQRFTAFTKRWTALAALHAISDFSMCAVHTVVFGALYMLLERPPGVSLTDVYRVIGPSNMAMGMALYLTILITDYATDFHRKFRDEQLRATRLEAHLAQAQLQALKMQLHPHFLFNALNSISSLVLEDPRASVHMIARLGDFLRLTLEHDQTQAVTLERELEFLKCYLEIEQIRFRDRLQVEFDIEPETLSARVPNLVLQPLVENALKHGIARRAASGRVSVQAKRRGNRLVLAVANDGPKRAGETGFDSSDKPGIGLSNTRERLNQLHGDDFRLDLRFRAEGGAAVTIDVPFNGSPSRTNEFQAVEVLHDGGIEVSSVDR